MTTSPRFGCADVDRMRVGTWLAPSTARREDPTARGDRDVGEPFGAVRAEVGDSGLTVERRADEDQRMMMELDVSVARGLGAGTRGDAVGGHRVGHLSVEAEDLRLRRLSLEVQEVRRAGLLHAHASAPEVQRTLVASDRERLAGGFHRHVLTEVPVGAFPFEDEGLHGTHSFPAAECGGDVGEHLLVGRHRRARGAAREDHGHRTIVESWPRRCHVVRARVKTPL